MITQQLIETINDLVYMIENRTLTAKEKAELETKSLSLRALFFLYFLFIFLQL